MSARNSRALGLILLVAAGACSDTVTGPEVGPAPEVLFSHSVGDPQPHTYTFEGCDDEDLAIEVLTGAASCVDGVWVLDAFTQVRITLGGTADAVSADLTGDAALLFLNENLEPLGPDDAIWYVDVLTFLGGTFDNLLVNYLTVHEAAADPETKEACKDGGWEAFGFANQGQCVRFVNTGQDSRGVLPEQAGPKGTRP